MGRRLIYRALGEFGCMFLNQLKASSPFGYFKLTVKKYLIKSSFSFLKFDIFVDLERKNEFHGSIGDFDNFLVRCLIFVDAP